MDGFLQKFKKVVRIVLYGPTVSKSDCKKAGPYQLPYSKSTHHFRIVFKLFSLETVFKNALDEFKMQCFEGYY